MTVLDLAVTAASAPPLYQVSIGHPVWLAGISALFAAMFVTLVHIWIRTLRGRFR
jgi:hypothetical protein